MKGGENMKKYMPLMLVALVIFCVAGNAMAAPLVDVTDLEVDTTALATVGGVILAGLASIWGFRKLVKSINRS